jgi:hypothetical protein
MASDPGSIVRDPIWTKRDTLDASGAYRMNGKYAGTLRW